MRTRLIVALALALLERSGAQRLRRVHQDRHSRKPGQLDRRRPPASSTAATGDDNDLEQRRRRRPSGSGSAGQSTTPSQTRTATEPQFDQSQSQSAPAGSPAAAAVVRAHGYTADNLSEYHPSQTLRALVGTRSGSADGYGQQVFFFVDGRFIGTDAKEPSASVKVVSQSDTEAVVAYPLYRPSDPLSSPSGGHALVHFQLDNGMLVPVGTIPPVHSSSAPSRL